MSTSASSPSTRQTVTLTWAAVRTLSVIGICLVFIFIGYPPGWTPYAAGILLAVIYFTAASFGWRGSEAIWMMSFTVLLMTMFWDIRNPIGSFPGLVLAVLTLMSQNQKHEAASEPAEPTERPEPSE